MNHCNFNRTMGSHPSTNWLCEKVSSFFKNSFPLLVIFQYDFKNADKGIKLYQAYINVFTNYNVYL